MHIKPFEIAHSQAGMACYTNHKISERDVDGYYYVTVVYHFMVDTLNARGVHGKSVKEATLKQFQIVAI